MSPFLAQDFLARLFNAVEDRSYAAWIPVVPVSDTLKRVANQTVVETVDRTQVQRVQTPQVFEYSVIRSLHQKAGDLGNNAFTDDASLCEYYGIPVGTFKGDIRNIKLTYEFEQKTLRLILNEGERELPCESESDTTFTG